ncbi:hypothetical protein NUW58_g8575 [Xylaria curta]|uniref:Uncharacterized protein n=1 Tax=Xylaria curta TaxID=42375 RepID=A0ACC1N6Z9_9PEZI|nr:hypothetical protein NUW58_g8575 [Xylaria curta]
MYDAWIEFTGGRVGVLGSGSDYTAFVHKGIGAVSTEWMPTSTLPTPLIDETTTRSIWEQTEDLTTQYTIIIAITIRTIGCLPSYLTLLAYNLATVESLPLNVSNWVTQMEIYYNDLTATINSAPHTLDTSSLRSALDEFASRAQEIAALEQQAVENKDAALITVVNHKKRDFQRGFVSQGGLPTREFYRNLVFAPGLDTGYAATTFPGITESFKAGNLSVAAEYVKRTADAILVAANIIKT